MRARFWVALGSVAAVLAALIWYFFIRSDPLAEHVEDLLIAMPTRGSDATINDLWALGPRVIPHLARKAGEREGFFSKAYRFSRSKLPNGVRPLLPKAPDPGQIRASAMEMIVGLGPLAVYGAAREVTEGLNDPVQRAQVYAEYGVEWLVPEYPPALKAYTQRFANMNREVPIRNLTVSVSEPIWGKTPALLPSLIARLEQPDQAHVAAIALRYCGSNATAAVPSLIETLDRGFAGAALQKIRRPENTSLDHNRAMAARALGELGEGSPAVMAALVRAWNQSDAWVRANAAYAITVLASNSNITVVPPELVTGLRDRDNRALAAKLEALASIGPPAREALPTIEAFTDTNYVRQWVNEPGQNAIPLRVGDIVARAKMAICEIDAEKGRSFINDIVALVGGPSFLPVTRLRRSQRLSNEIIQAMEPLLRATNDLRRSSLAAYIILGHERSHAEAIAVLQRNKTTGTLPDRLFAAERLHEAVGDTNGMLELIDEALSPELGVGQWGISVAAKMRAIPTLRRALWHKDKFVRQRAGLALRRLAPEELWLKGNQAP